MRTVAITPPPDSQASSGRSATALHGGGPGDHGNKAQPRPGRSSDRRAVATGTSHVVGETDIERGEVAVNEQPVLGL